MFEKIAHIGVAVKDIKASTKLFRKLFGKAPDHTESLPEYKVHTVMFEIGHSSIELTEATDAESPIARFIEKRGEGVHHVSFVVDDIEKEIARLKQQGFQMIDDKPRLGADNYYVAFLHPKSTNGVLVEISQKKA
ncbi:MAG: methylmalonyl-CoA epimerase [Ignavibacteriales bacterium]|nr:methylmalonyl-CoA epimerase [Ignavibacteriales bacterium]